MSTSTNAQRLKDEGNVLFAHKDFLGAYAKYTDAIKEDDQNAVLYANRSACSLSLQRNLEAVNDARKAVQLDPSYAKGWARLATARYELGQWADSMWAWTRALDALPRSNLSAAEQQSKDQYLPALRKAEHSLQSVPDVTQNGSNAAPLDAPWIRARNLIVDLTRAQDEKSSAWVIHYAHNDFSMGTRLAVLIRMVKARGEELGEAHPSALVNLSNGLLRDKRVLHEDGSWWLRNFDDIVIMESKQRGAWLSAGPDVVLNEARNRVRSKGWGAVQPALDITVRTWIMRAIIADTARYDSHSAVQLYDQAIEVITRGAEIWRDVSESDRGIIFSAPFLRGIEVIRLEAFMKAQAARDDNAYTVKKLMNLAGQLLSKANAARPDSAEHHDKGFLLSFYSYPIAEAHAAVAYSAMQMSAIAAPSQWKQCLQRAGDEYLAAANAYAEDDEKHCFSLYCTLNSWSPTKPPLRKTLPVAERIRAAIPNMRKIWGSSPLIPERDSQLQRALTFETKARKLLAEGKATLDTELECF